jgi:TATA-box binding protein (TBP) (component of TFIID and TFIIIB)
MDFKISTRTVIASTNVEFKINEIYHQLPALELDESYQQRYFALLPVKKRRGRRKKNDDSLDALKKELEDMVEPKPGDIVAVYFRHNKKGLPQYLKYGVKFFRNALNIVMMIHTTKRINLKLSQNGKIQMTGCKHENDAKLCLRFLFKHLLENCRDSIVFKDAECDRGRQLEVCYFTVMTNLDFNIGFHINRQKLNNLVNGKTVFNSLLETSFGYTGVNIKIEVPYDGGMGIDQIRFDWKTDDFSHSTVTYSNYLKQFGNSYYENEKQKKRYNTFLVFHSGNIIMSGMRLDKMTKHFKEFCDFLIEHRNDIEEVMV